jgi:hypothetical protein
MAEVNVLSVDRQGDNLAVVTLGSDNLDVFTTTSARRLAIEAAAQHGISRPGFAGYGDTAFKMSDGTRVTDEADLSARLQKGERLKSYERQLTVQGGL